MRFIDLSKLVVPDGWEAKAKAARGAVEEIAPEERRKIIDDHSKVWRDLKAALEKLSYGKCWYSEAKVIGSDRDVDHFRPKNAVYGTDHGGYWWLAFEKRNYRYSCNFCNRPRTDEASGHKGGKHDRFPLWDETTRVKQPSDDITKEQPLLLDPCVASDPPLLTFAENGEALPRYSEKEKPRMYRRAKTSIELYHLNHSDFVSARLELGQKLEDLITQADRYFKSLDEASADIEYAFAKAIEQIYKHLTPEAEFSAFARTIVEKHRTKECLAGIA